MQVLGLNHVSVIVQDAQRALAFYQQVLELEKLSRPALGFPGYWLDLGGGQSLHLMQLPDPCVGGEKPAHGGRDRHFALSVESVAGFADKLERLGVPYTRSRSGRAALFFRDPDGNVIELCEINV